MSEFVYKNLIVADLDKPLVRHDVGVVMANGDALANRFGVQVNKNGESVDLSGCTIKGFLILPSDETMELEGHSEDGTAYVDIPEDGYAYDGAFTLTVKVYGDNFKKAVAIFDGRIARSISEAVIHGDRVVYTSEKVLEMIVEMEQLTAKSWDATTKAYTSASLANDAAERAGVAAEDVQKSLDELEHYAGLAEHAASEANAANADAQAAVKAAQNAAANAPYIGENGNWYVWDSDTSSYVDTGVSTKSSGAEVDYVVAEKVADKDSVCVVEDTQASVSASDNDAYFTDEYIVVNNGTYKLTKEGMLGLIGKNVTGNGSVAWNNWGSMNWGDTESMLSGAAKARYFDDPVYLSMKLPSEAYHASNVIEHPGMRHANSTGAYTYLSTIGAVYAPDYTLLPDTVTVCIGNISLYTLSDEPNANWVLHEHCSYPAGYGMFYIPWSKCGDANVSIPSSAVELHENYAKFTLSKNDFAPSESVSQSTGAVLHFWASNNVDIDLTKTKAAIAMYEMWTETEAAADLMYIDIGADQKNADKTAISQLFWSRNYNIQTEKRLVLGHNISDILYDELRGSKNDPRHVLSHYYAPISTATQRDEVEAMVSAHNADETAHADIRNSIDDMYIVAEKLPTANIFDGVMEEGHINASGNSVAYAGYLRSANYTSVIGDQTIMGILAEPIIGNTNSFYIAEYDSSKNFIKRTEVRPAYNSKGANNDSATVSKQLTLSSNAAYIKFSVYVNGSIADIEDLNSVKIAIAYVGDNLTQYVEPFEITKIPYIDGAKIALQSSGGTLYSLVVLDDGTLSTALITV